MKISYILQLKDFCILFAIGIGLGIIYGILNIFARIKKNIVVQIISDILFSTIAFLTFILMINLINMGQFRMFLLIGYLLGFYLERITLGKLFAKGYKKLYNFIVKVLKKFAQSKIGKVLLK